MTETRFFIRPADVMGLEFECPHCKTVIIYGIDNIDRLPSLCQNCMEPLLKEGTDDEATVKRFVTALRKLKDFSFRIRVEVKPEQ
jgi:hypothetical protein